MRPYDCWLEKSFTPRATKHLVHAIEDLVERRPVRIAHIEDDTDDAMLTARLLHRKDWSVTRFASYEEGKKALVDGDISQYDCVLTDIMLPAGWEGLRLARLIKNARPEMPIVTFTNCAEPDPARVDGLSAA